MGISLAGEQFLKVYRGHNAIMWMLGSEGKASALRFVGLPRVVVGRFGGSTIGMAIDQGKFS